MLGGGGGDENGKNEKEPQAQLGFETMLIKTIQMPFLVRERMDETRDAPKGGPKPNHHNVGQAYKRVS